MTIDIENLEEDALLPTLGDGAWHIALPSPMTDFVLLPEQRQTFVGMACDQYVRWVLEGIDIQIVHDADPPWDSSGSPRKTSIDPLTLRARHATLSHWMADEHTGQSQATYLSGMGLSWQTYDEWLDGTILQSAIGEMLKTHCMKFYDPAQDYDTWEDRLWDDIVGVETNLMRALHLYVGRVTTAEAWAEYGAFVRGQMDAEQRANETRWAHERLMDEAVREFWAAYFPDLASDDFAAQRIEYPRFEATGLEKRLREILQDIDPLIVESIAERGIPGNHSNSVLGRIRQIARDALNGDAGDLP